jgi:cell division protein FtsB
MPGGDTMNFRIKRLPKLYALPNPEDSLRSLVERAPQAEAWADRMKEKLGPTATALYSIRRRLATGAIAVFTLWLFAHVMFGANGMIVYRQKKAEYQSQQKEIGELQKENDSYTQKIKELQTDPKMIEKEAREQLHYARPGEVVYVTPAPPSPTRESRTAEK